MVCATASTTSACGHPGSAVYRSTRRSRSSRISAPAGRPHAEPSARWRPAGDAAEHGGDRRVLGSKPHDDTRAPKAGLARGPDQQLLFATSAHATHRRGLGSTDAAGANRSAGSCKHESGHDGVDVSTAAVGVKEQSVDRDPWSASGGLNESRQSCFSSATSISPTPSPDSQRAELRIYRGRTRRAPDDI